MNCFGSSAQLLLQNFQTSFDFDRYNPPPPLPPPLSYPMQDTPRLLSQANPQATPWTTLFLFPWTFNYGKPFKRLFQGFILRLTQNAFVKDNSNKKKPTKL